MRKGLFVVLMGISLICWGCGTLPNSRGWGQDATLFPGWARVGTAALDAGRAPETWAPALTAVLLQIDDADREISDWAMEQTPVFGSRDGADRTSDYLAGAAGAAYVVTAMATPSGDDSEQWLLSKMKGMAAGAVATGLTIKTTHLVKNVTDRERPNGSDNRSLPSVHASGSAALTTLANRNLQYLSLSKRSSAIMRIGFTGIALGSGWGRVEAGEHYPSDVLVGYALGHFISAVVNDAFLGVESGQGPQIVLGTEKNGIALWVCMGF